MKINKEWFENVKNIIKFQVAKYSLSKARETPTEKREIFKVTNKGPELYISNLEPGTTVEIEIKQRLTDYIKSNNILKIREELRCTKQ